MHHEGLFLNLHDHLPPEMIYERELLILSVVGLSLRLLQPQNYSHKMVRPPSGFP